MIKDCSAELSPKKKRENVGILKKQRGVYPNPTSFVI